MNIRKVFAANVRHHRKALGLSQEKLAELAGLHRTYIGGIEQQRVNVSLKNIGRIADALGIEPIELFVNGGADSSAAWRQAVSDAKESLALAADLANGAGRGPMLAVATWDRGKIAIEPLEVAYEDLTVQVLVELVQRGYSGDELLKQYKLVSGEIRRFLSR